MAPTTGKHPGESRLSEGEREEMKKGDNAQEDMVRAQETLRRSSGEAQEAGFAGVLV